MNIHIYIFHTFRYVQLENQIPTVFQELSQGSASDGKIDGNLNCHEGASARSSRISLKKVTKIAPLRPKSRLGGKLVSYLWRMSSRRGFFFNVDSQPSYHSFFSWNFAAEKKVLVLKENFSLTFIYSYNFQPSSLMESQL